MESKYVFKEVAEAVEWQLEGGVGFAAREEGLLWLVGEKMDAAWSGGGEGYDW